MPEAAGLNSLTGVSTQIQPGPQISVSLAAPAGVEARRPKTWDDDAVRDGAAGVAVSGRCLEGSFLCMRAFDPTNTFRVANYRFVARFATQNDSKRNFQHMQLYHLC